MKIFAKHETLKNPLFSDFQNELIHEKTFSPQEKNKTTALSGFIFTELEPELSHISIINTFASEDRKMIDKVMKEKSRLKKSRKSPLK